MPTLGRETRPRAIAFVIDSAWRRPSSSYSILRDLFGLTPAEVEVAAGLSGGLTPRDIAVSRATSIATVQTQIKSALAKTGVSRQSALVALVSRLAVS